MGCTLFTVGGKTYLASLSASALNTVLDAIDLT